MLVGSQLLMCCSVRDCAVPVCVHLLHRPPASLQQSTTATSHRWQCGSTTQHSTPTTTTTCSVSQTITSPLVSSVLLLHTDPEWGWRDQVTVATSDVNITELSQSSLDIQLDLKCHLAFNNYPQLRHNSQTSITSIINFVKITTNHLVNPNTEMLDSFKQFYLRAKRYYRLCSISFQINSKESIQVFSRVLLEFLTKCRYELVASNTIRNKIISIKIF